MLDRLFQEIMDCVVGIALYFGLSALIPALGNNAIVLLMLIGTVVYAENVENVIKRISKEKDKDKDKNKDNK